jgi:hypothetical protein
MNEPGESQQELGDISEASVALAKEDSISKGISSSSKQQVVNSNSRGPVIILNRYTFPRWSHKCLFSLLCSNQIQTRLLSLINIFPPFFVSFAISLLRMLSCLVNFLHLGFCGGV